jgi:uncharacterized protein YdhG (YjbR/CyaY superfamily)
MRKGAPKAKTVDGYLAALDPEKRAALEKLRKQIHAAIPGATECISYGMPGFRHEGKVVAWKGAAATHCALYPGGIVDEFKADLKGYDVSKGTVRFAPDDPLPAALVKKLVKAAVARRFA